MDGAVADSLVSAEPVGAFRILARQDDSQVLIVHGTDRVASIEAGERVAWVEWLPSIDVAAAVSHFCSLRLTEAFPPDADGWHPYPVQHLKTLVALARNHLNITYQPEPVPRERQAWTGQRCAHLGFRAGQGWTAKRIAEDPLIRTTPNNVHRQAQRFGLSLSEKPHGLVSIRLPAATVAAFDRAAARANLTRDAFIARFLIAHSEQIDVLVPA